MLLFNTRPFQHGREKIQTDKNNEKKKKKLKPIKLLQKII